VHSVMFDVPIEKSSWIAVRIAAARIRIRCLCWLTGSRSCVSPQSECVLRR